MSEGAEVCGRDHGVGVLGAVLGGLHLTGVPPVIVLSLTATFGWLVSYTVASLLGLPGRGRGAATPAGRQHRPVAAVPGV
ncbi:hypothetical protein BH23ACT9_BH23ACT9_30170 [soil metagenome]